MSFPSLRTTTPVDGRRLGAVAAATGVVLAIVAYVALLAGVVDPFANISSAKYMSKIDSAPHLWLGVHLVIAVAMLFKLVGMLNIAELIDGGTRSALVRTANALTVVGTTLFIVTMVFDGYVHGYLAARWEHAAPGSRTSWENVFGESLRTSYGMEIASTLAVLGLAPILYGVAMRGSATLPAWLSRLGVYGGAGAILTAAVLWLGGVSTVGYGVLYPVFAAIVPAVWLLGLARYSWRAAGSSGATSTRTSAASSAHPPTESVAV